MSVSRYISAVIALWRRFVKSRSVFPFNRLLQYRWLVSYVRSFEYAYSQSNTRLRLCDQKAYTSVKWTTQQSFSGLKYATLQLHHKFNDSINSTQHQFLCRPTKISSFHFACAIIVLRWLRSLLNKNAESRKQNRIIHVLKIDTALYKFENTSFASTLRNERMHVLTARRQCRICSYAWQEYSALFYNNIKYMKYQSYIHCICQLIFINMAGQVISVLCDNAFHIQAMQSVQCWYVNYIWPRQRVEMVRFCE
ncbi:Hypothetical_protein [Hexamita inflata]|uniref:Hypothetical_protein n=1 Tax=Hexamita inflata TaxID=28002 RepID=A0ABP1GMI1_9EUKA